MYLDIVPNRNSRPAVLLRRSFRENGKIKKVTLANLTGLDNDQIDAIRLALKGERLVSANESFQIKRSLPHGNVAAVLGTLKAAGLDKVLSSRPCRQRDLVLSMIVERVLSPGSKLAISRELNSETATSTLCDVLKLSEVDEDELYAAMDWLLDRQGSIESKLAKKHLQGGSLVLYDVSSSYYTGTHCELAHFGHNRDGKKRYPQVVYGLMCNGEGCPVAIEVFEGNTADPTTLESQIKKLTQRFGLERVILVGDRGMITSARIRDELKRVEGLEWISALGSKAVQQLEKQGVIQPSLFDQRNLVEVHSEVYPGERLVVCKNPLLAEERSRKREELLKATEAGLQKIVAATRREKRPLKGKEKIALRVGRMINRYRMAKHFQLDITEDGFSWERRNDKIEAEAKLDGIYIIRTSVKKEILSANETVQTYKNLSRVERAFRSLKTVDLKIRPIFHRNTNRVRAHIFLCMLAYYVEWHMRAKLAPVLFDDEERESSETQKVSAAYPAKRSPSALSKAQSKRGSDHEPIHSFQTLLKDLATITRNRMGSRICKGPASNTVSEFDLLTTPTPLQRKVFDLLEIKLTL